MGLPTATGASEAAPTLDNYAEVFRTIPVVDYAWHSLLVGIGTRFARPRPPGLAVFSLERIRRRI